MATYYSNVFTGIEPTVASTKSGTSITQEQSTVHAHARSRKAIGRIRIDADEDFGTSDVAHMFMLKPTDRLLWLRITCGDAGTTGDVNIGTYTVSQANGAFTFTLDDADLFASALDINAAALTWSDVMHESGTVGINYIGEPMWKIADLGAGTFTADSNDIFAISISPSEVTTADDLDIVLVASYIAGD